VTDSRHSDNFRRGDAATGAVAKDKPATAPKTTDNEARAALAEAQRERTFTMGGDAPEGSTPPGAPASPATPTAPDDSASQPRPTPILDAALRRLASDHASGQRPSPFGVAHFPPLPVPPGTK